MMGSPDTGMFAWYKADAGITADGLSRVTNWADRTTNHYDMAPVDSVGLPSAVINWPTYSAAGGPNGLPAVQFSGFQWLMYNVPGLALNVPTADGSPIMAFALLKPTAADLGIACTMRGTVYDLEFGIRRAFGNEYMMSSRQDHDGMVWDSHLANRTGQTLVLSWIYGGAGSGSMTINGLPVPLTNVNGNEPILAYNGITRFAIGYIPAVAAGYLSAMLTELILYPGFDLGTQQRTTEYLMDRGGIGSSPHPPLQSATGPSAAIGAAATGHVFRYAPKAFGDQFNNPGEGS